MRVARPVRRAGRGNGAGAIPKPRPGPTPTKCARGALHEGPALSVSLSGKSVTISLRQAEVGVVAAALEHYRQRRESLEEQATRAVAQLRARNAGNARG